MGDFIEVPTVQGGRMPAYYVQASGQGPHAGLILLQEIFGVNANMRQTADAYAALGYDVIVPDLFWRQEVRVELDPASGPDRERATALMKGLDQAQAVKDSLAAAAYLVASGRSSGSVGAVGYCLGGKLAYLLATHSEIAAAISYYGVAINAVLDRANDLVAPLLLHIAVEDSLCPAEAQAAIHDTLDGHANVEIMDHSGVGHAFARLGSAAYDQAAAESANAATAAFLARHLDASR